MAETQSVASWALAHAEYRPLVSVVVTTYTRARLQALQDLLDSLKSQTYPKLEIIFVAKGPAELREKVKNYAQIRGLTDLNVIADQTTLGLSAARNLGASYAKGEIIAFIDDDAVAFPEWVENIVRTLAEHPQAIGVTGPAFPQWEGSTLDWFPEEFYWLLSCPTSGWTGYKRPMPVRNAWGVNMSFRREAFEVARFSETFVGGEKTGADDVDFSMQVRRATGSVILFHPSVCVFHKVSRHRISMRFIRGKAFRDAYAKVFLKVLYPQKQGTCFKIDLEMTLLRNILLRFFPAMLARLVWDPVGAWHQFRLASVALFYTGAGYLMGTLSLLRIHFRKTINLRGPR